ncbi:TetR/AcrR family transcriptional regulator [Rhodococcus sp. Eu-32]|uniref:TetR/AcrR family transcriptional regulator n=1 Tax=Rhodococcus sp. Eu-32 TaxID=1017319 RepID=UPI000DF3C189|nr:TetR/AcrR family transcriptional regulator [Rhodococcus sp. Eu-32]RRQ28316.1 TetR/AcrR family transcriptional regulator [Rhodococcus sp. Eu-32]
MATTTGAGRPRLSTKKRPGDTAREEILDASAELFTTRGYTSTSTRMIADAVGLRQASLYHHFAGKDDILDALLGGTVDEPLAVGRGVAESDASAAVKMYALVLFDADQLARSTWNLGALYLLPELRADRFDAFRQHRYALMNIYASLASATASELGVDALPGTEELPFRLVETVVNGRADAENGRGVPAVEYAKTIADAAVRVLGWVGPTDTLRTEAVRLLDCSAAVETVWTARLPS